MKKILEPVFVPAWMSRFLISCRNYFVKISGIFFPDNRKKIPNIYTSLLLINIIASILPFKIMDNYLINQLNIRQVSDLKDSWTVN